MKIAVNTRFLLANKLEGIGWFSYETLKRWVAWYPEHEFIFIFDRPYDPQFIFGDNVTPVVAFPPARHPILFYLWFEWALPRIFRKHKPDYFVSPDGFLSLRTKIPTQLVIHDIAWKHFPTHIPNAHLRHYDLQVPSNKIDVVYDGSNEAFQPVSNLLQGEIRNKYSQGQPYFLYVGSIHPRKNVGRLLQAFDQFKTQYSSPLKLLLVGRMAWQSGEIGQIVQQLKHSKDVIFLGYTPPTELPSIVGSAYAMVYISLFEGFGLPILEAMYSNVPSISSNSSSMPEVTGDAGLSVDPYSLDSIASAMANLWNNKELRLRLIEKGKIQRRLFSWDLTAEKLWTSLLKIPLKNS